MRRYKHNGSAIRTNIRNTGMVFENCINAVNNIYFAKGLGLIKKQNTPFIPLRDRTGKVVDVKVADKAIADYAGVYGRYAVAFEAKSCSSDKFELSRLKSHQLETLAYYTKLGHIAFLFLSFSEQDFYILPYEVISAVITKKTDSIQWGNITQPVSRYKHIKKSEIDDFFKINIRNSKNGISFLDYMVAVGRIYSLEISD